ncbi:FAD-dependent oxidoreductase [Undibacterium sp.]|jgi:glycine/D-amino acid oxidase-like deaminating enzyme|uniref:NAD(P)/FAD-dependent oxidoreductase n=1 Tax=Undibacterium sp. TaxID=1914977 RepID=UPI002CE429F9|nr:FAD-dependent oxidoreductase [Undibacterium sp.]HTD04238.1 FAD-dependent oxidoreductase [Undibacterium sp.]
MTADVIVIGAGIIGCACAAALSAQGMRVTVIEASTTGGGATAAGMGHLVVMDDNPAELALTQRSLQLWRALVQGQEARHEYSRCGTLWIAADEEEMAAARIKHSVLNAHGVACELLDEQAVHQAEPALRRGLAGGLLVAGDALVYPPKSAQLLLDQAVAAGARLVQAQVSGITGNGVLCSDGRQLHAGKVVVANGLAAATLLPDLPLRAKKGHLLITDRYPGFIRHQLVELGYIKSAHASEGDSVAFNLQPRPTGQILIGSSRQFDTADKTVEIAMLRKMLAHAAGFVPQLAQLNVLRSWTGLRAATPDGLPLIGPHPVRENIWLAVGHEGLGITTSLATAELLAAQISGSAAAIAATPYLPSRLLTRA